MVLGSEPSEKKNILANNFGGLNTTLSPFNIPLEDSPMLLNVDVDVSGKVKKRKGTRLIWKETTPDKVFPTEISSNTGISFLVARIGQSLRVYDVINDTAVVLRQFDNVFKPNIGYPDYVILPGDKVRLLILHAHSCPVQLQIHEYTIQTPGGVSYDVPSEFQSIGVQAVYINGTVAQFSYLYPTITISSPVSSDDVIVLIGFSWQWWAESLSWFGDNFHRAVNRFGVSQSDQHVQVPTTIYSDLPRNAEPNEYGIIGFATNKFDDRYIYKNDNKPQNAFEYSFGDGANYTYTPTQSVTPSPFFMTFGEESAYAKGKISESNLVPPNILNILDHNFSTYDTIVFSPFPDFINGLFPNTPYYIEVIDKDNVRLWQNPDLSGAISFIASTELEFTDANIDYARNEIINIISPYSVGVVKRVQFANSTYLLPSGIQPGQYYYIVPITNTVIEVYFDERATRRVDFVPRPERAFVSANVDDTTDTITIANHLLFQKDGVRFYPYTGSTLPGGIVEGTVYYVDPINPNAFSLYADADLTTLVDITNAGSGDF